MEHCKGGAARARLTKTTIWERTQMGGVSMHVMAIRAILRATI